MRVSALISVDLPWALQLVDGWRAAGDDVTVVLLDGAVAAARAGHVHADALAALLSSGVSILAEEQAIARRALGADRTIPGVKSTDLDQLADLLLDGSDRVVWL